MAIAQHGPDSDPAIALQARTIASVAVSMLATVRDLMHRLRPVVLDELGLAPALEQLTDDWNARNGDAFCALRISGGDGGVDEAIEIGFYRIVQEALTNVSRHADAQQVEIALTINDGCLRLTINDDGHGFDPTTTPRGLGLAGMQERVAALNGHFVLRTAPGHGTIIDIALPARIGGLEAIRRIVARAARARVLVFSVHEEPVFAEKALAAGARGYLTKASAPEQLVEAIRTLAAGGIHVESRIAQHLAFHKSRGEETPFATLTAREFEIGPLLAEGVAVNDIARRLALSTQTVANYATQVKNKLGVASTGELTRLAIRYGIVTA